jgi:hypothetical protein
MTWQQCQLQHSSKVDGTWRRGTDETPGKVTCANGAIQVKMRCNACGSKSGALPYLVVREWGISEDDCLWQVVNPPYEHQPCVVEDCGAVPTEWHHFAPRNTFGTEADLWPVLPLCVAHHRAWHQRMDGYRWHRKAVA